MPCSSCILRSHRRVHYSIFNLISPEDLNSLITIRLLCSQSYIQARIYESFIHEIPIETPNYTPLHVGDLPAYVLKLQFILIIKSDLKHFTENLNTNSMMFILSRYITSFITCEISSPSPHNNFIFYTISYIFVYLYDFNLFHHFFCNLICNIIHICTCVHVYQFYTHYYVRHKKLLPIHRVQHIHMLPTHQRINLRNGGTSSTNIT